MPDPASINVHFTRSTYSILALYLSYSLRLLTPSIRLNRRRVAMLCCRIWAKFPACVESSLLLARVAFEAGPPHSQWLASSMNQLVRRKCAHRALFEG